MNTEISDWEQFYADGVRYHRTANGSVRRPKVFTPLLIENVAAMGIEKYFMAIFMHRGMLPNNHTMLDFIEAAKTVLDLPQEIVESLTYMDSLQRICSLETYSIIPPSTDDVPRFIAAIDAVANLARRELGPPPSLD